MTASATARMIHGIDGMFWKIQGAAWSAFTSLVLLLYAPVRTSAIAIEIFLLKVTCAVLASLVLRFVCRLVWRRRQVFVPLAFAAIACAGLLGICVGWSVDALTHNMWGVPDTVVFHAVVTSSLRYQFVLMAWCVGYFTIKFFVQSQRRLQLVRAAERQQKEAMLAAYRYQLPRRFLTDTLEAIASVIQTTNASTGSRAIAQFANLLRGMLQNPDIHVAPLRNELDLLDGYLSLLRDIGRSELILTLDIEDDLRDESVPRWLLIPVVDEYAQIYASGPSVMWNLSMSVRRHDDVLLFRIWGANSNREQFVSRHDREFHFLNSLLELSYAGRASFEVIGNGELIIRLPQRSLALE